MSSVDTALAEGEIALAHISDLHLGHDKKDEDAWVLLEQILKKLKPTLLLVSGDLVDTPKKEHFSKALVKLQGLDIPFYACLGNHDWYRKGNRVNHRLIFGNFKVRLVFAAIFAIGVFAIAWCSGWRSLWFLAVPVALAFVPWAGCRFWNWVDRHGNDIEKYILGHEKAIQVKLPSETNPDWTIGLLGIDSSKDADVSARGSVNRLWFDPVAKATRGHDWDLCICLIHHHLISIRKLEADREGNRLELLNLTTLVNSGSLLEALVTAQVDLVLHGHEHAPNWLSYSSCEAGYEPLRVVAAGSATGMGKHGYKSDDATFNLIILAPDRSIRLRRYFYSAGKWATDPDVPLFDAVAVRQSRLRRARAVRQISAEVTKYVEYTRERDIRISWLYRNWRLEPSGFVQTVWNTTGEPDNLDVEIWFHGDDAPRKPDRKDLSLHKLDEDKHAWEIRWPVKTVWANRAALVRMSFRWRGGGVLTAEEMKHVRDGKRAGGTPRLNGHEYETVWTEETVAFAELIVVLPTEYAPQDAPAIRVEKVVEERKDRLTPSVKTTKQVPSDESELAQYLRYPAAGKFALRVPFPYPHYDYTLSWKPVSEAVVAERMANTQPEEQFRRTAQTKGIALLNAFSRILKQGGLAGNVTLGLYVRKGNLPDGSRDLTLERTEWTALIPTNGAKLKPNEANDSTGQATGATVPGHKVEPEPPKSIPFKGESQVTTLAWWGQPQVMTRPEDEANAAACGFTDSLECALCAVPLRFNLNSATSAPPWGLVRIALIDNQDALIDNQDNDLQKPKETVMLQPFADEVLQAATAALLSVALEENLNRGVEGQ